MSTGCIDRSTHNKTPPHLNHSGKHTLGIEGVISSEEGKPIISGPAPTTYWQKFCTVPTGPLSRVKKEMHHSSSVKGCISVTSHVLKLLSILEFWNGVFLHIVTKSIGKKKYSTKFIYLHSSTKETFHGAFIRLSVVYPKMVLNVPCGDV